MHIKRLKITLPPRMKDTAQHDARAMAEAIAVTLHANGGQVKDLNLPGHGQNGLALATRVAAALPKPSGGNGHGS